jgi:HK97 gp10 family phage protein
MARGGSTSRGMRLDLSQKNVAGTIARIYSKQKDVVAACVATTRAAGEFCRELTAALAPKRTGRMARLVTTEYSTDGLAFETGWRASDFIEEGEDFYPPYQEFGTRFMPAQPSLYPAYKETQQFYLEELRANIRAALAASGTSGVPGGGL